MMHTEMFSHFINRLYFMIIQMKKVPLLMSLRKACIFLFNFHKLNKHDVFVGDPKLLSSSLLYSQCQADESA